MADDSKRSRTWAEPEMTRFPIRNRRRNHDGWRKQHGSAEPRTFEGRNANSRDHTLGRGGVPLTATAREKKAQSNYDIKCFSLTGTRPRKRRKILSSRPILSLVATQPQHRRALGTANSAPLQDTHTHTLTDTYLHRRDDERERPVARGRGRLGGEPAVAAAALGAALAPPDRGRRPPRERVRRRRARGRIAERGRDGLERLEEDDGNDLLVVRTANNPYAPRQRCGSSATTWSTTVGTGHESCVSS